MIGFDLLNTTIGSISKWEKSFFGGFNRLITDYPSIDLDFNVDFDFAPVEKLSYFEMSKLLKIFLIKAVNRKLIEQLMENPVTTKEIFYGQTIIKTTVDKESIRAVLGLLTRYEKEYAPLFRHYKEFIIDSKIYFQKFENSNEENEDKENEDEKENGENENGKEQENKSNSEKQDSEKQEEKQEEKNKSEKKSEQQQKTGKKVSAKEKNQNIRDFTKALKKTREFKPWYKEKKLCNFDKKTIIKILPQDPSETKFTPKEIAVADNLFKMLDISFDPDSDIVKNLRLGKLDVSKIAEIPAGNVAIYQQQIENQITKPFSVAILCDESGSMEYANRIKPQYHIVKSLYKCFSEILPQDKIFVYGHTGIPAPELYTYQDRYNQNFLTTIDSMLERENGNNYDGPVIEEIHKNIRAVTQDRIIFIVLSDGAPSGDGYGDEDDIEDMKKIIEKCKRDEFVTVGIGIEASHVKNLYQYSTIIKNMGEMSKKVSHILNHVVRTEFQ